MTSRNLQAWAILPTEQLSAMDAAMETLLTLSRTLALDPSDAVRDDLERRLVYGIERLTARLQEAVPEDEATRVTDIRLVRMEGLQAYLDGHFTLADAGDELLPAIEQARQCFDRGGMLLDRAQQALEDLLVLCPYQG